MSGWGVTGLSLTAHPETGKDPFSTKLNSSSKIPTLLYFHALLHFAYQVQKKKWTSCQSPTQIVKTRLGLKILLCAQVLGPSPGLKHRLTETGNKALLIPDCAKTHSVQHL